jgi:hypothetical protein
MLGSARGVGLLVVFGSELDCSIGDAERSAKGVKIEAFPVSNFGLPDSPFLASLVVTFPASLAMLYGKLPNFSAPTARNTVATLLCLKIPPGASCLKIFPVSSTFFLALS